MESAGALDTSIDGSMLDTVIRDILKECGNLPVDPDNVSEQDDLYQVGLTSFATVQVMLAIEERFGIEFPNQALNRRTFSSIQALRGRLEQMIKERV